MPIKTVKALVCAVLVAIICNASYAAEEEFNLTKSVQKDLVLLGYEPGNVDGEVTLQTAVAISQFQAHNKLDVTGEVTPQLAGILAAKTSGPPQPLAQSAPPDEPSVQTEPAPQSEPVEQVAAAPEPEPEVVAEPVEIDPEVLEAARQKCIEKKIAKAQKAEKKRRGYGSLASAVGKSASLLGDDDLSKTVGDVSVASSTASDLTSAAKDLGLTEDDLQECENPL